MSCGCLVLRLAIRQHPQTYLAVQEFRAIASVGHTRHRAVAAEDRVARVSLNEATTSPPLEQTRQVQPEESILDFLELNRSRSLLFLALAAPSASEEIRLNNIARNKAFL